MGCKRNTMPSLSSSFGSGLGGSTSRQGSENQSFSLTRPAAIDYLLKGRHGLALLGLEEHQVRCALIVPVTGKTFETYPLVQVRTSGNAPSMALVKLRRGDDLGEAHVMVKLNGQRYNGARGAPEKPAPGGACRAAGSDWRVSGVFQGVAKRILRNEW